MEDYITSSKIDWNKYIEMDFNKSKIDILKIDDLFDIADNFVNYLTPKLSLNLSKDFGEFEYGFEFISDGYSDIHKSNIASGEFREESKDAGLCRFDKSLKLYIIDLNQYCVFNYFKPSLFDTILHEISHWLQKSYEIEFIRFEKAYEYLYNLVKENFMIKRTQYDDKIHFSTKVKLCGKVSRGKKILNGDYSGPHYWHRVDIVTNDFSKRLNNCI